ncbi:cereulide biosynthesis alpha/beta hydrolase CesH [Bacillus anthracis]|uniref:cereulide biosynthesis alpha/beta hydrolase CesH n=1 Tax=Bacillus anthracis TaxID=1392 RepID=UPI003D249BD5
MYYKEFGIEHERMMVYIHGGGVSSWMWDKQVDYFSQKFHCLVLDLPEHGYSRKDEQIFSIDHAAEKIIKLIEEKREGKSVVAIGFSLSSQVLLSMLSKKKDLIDFAMINSALAKPIPFTNILNKIMTMALPLVKNKIFSKVQAKQLYIGEEYFNLYYQESLHINKDTFLRIMNESSSFEILKTFKEYSHNILVTVGEKEKKIMKDSMKEIMANNPNCQGVIIPKIGHGIPLADPKLFNKMLVEWLDSNLIIGEVKLVSTS